MPRGKGGAHSSDDDISGQNLFSFSIAGLVEDSTAVGDGQAQERVATCRHVSQQWVEEHMVKEQ